MKDGEEPCAVERLINIGMVKTSLLAIYFVSFRTFVVELMNITWPLTSPLIYYIPKLLFPSVPDTCNFWQQILTSTEGLFACDRCTIINHRFLFFSQVCRNLFGLFEQNLYHSAALASQLTNEVCFCPPPYYILGPKEYLL